MKKFNNRRPPKDKSNFKYRVNDRIRVRTLRVISPEGEQLGVLSRDEALQKANQYELDLVEVAPDASPPVCKIMDFGKMQYEQSKKLKQQRKNKNQVVTKTVKLKPNIGENDLLRKIKDTQKFIDKGYRVIVQLIMRGRQRQHSRLAEDQTIFRINDELENAVMEKPQYQSGRVTAVFSKAPE